MNEETLKVLWESKKPQQGIEPKGRKIELKTISGEKIKRHFWRALAKLYQQGKAFRFEQLELLVKQLLLEDAIQNDERIPLLLDLFLKLYFEQAVQEGYIAKGRIDGYYVVIKEPKPEPTL